MHNRTKSDQVFECTKNLFPTPQGISTALKNNYIGLAYKNQPNYHHKGSLKLTLNPAENLMMESQSVSRPSEPTSYANNTTITNNTNIIVVGGKNVKINTGLSPRNIIQIGIKPLNPGYKQTLNPLSPHASIKTLLNKSQSNDTFANSGVNLTGLSEKKPSNDFSKSAVRVTSGTSLAFHKNSTSEPQQIIEIKPSGNQQKEEIIINNIRDEPLNIEEKNNLNQLKSKPFHRKNAKSEMPSQQNPGHYIIKQQEKIKAISSKNIPKLHMEINQMRKSSLSNKANTPRQISKTIVEAKMDPKREKEMKETVDYIKKCKSFPLICRLEIT